MESTTERDRDDIDDYQVSLGVSLFEKFRRNANTLGINIQDESGGIGSIDGPVIDKLIALDMKDIKLLEDRNYNASLIYKHGGYVNVDKDTEHQQHRMARKLIKEVGQHLFQGSGLMFVSLPLYIFEPQSLLARLPKSLVHTSLLTAGLDRARRTEYVTAFAISCLHEMVSFQKPFTPRDGETLEATLGNCEVTAELVYPHVGKIPPVVMILLRGPCWTLSARLSFTVKTSPRTLLGNIDGAFEVNYCDGGRVAWSFPPWKISGITTGTLWIRYKDNIIINNSSGEVCEITFAHKRFRHFRGSGSPVDEFTGAIYDAPAERRSRRELHKVHGRWLIDFQCDGRRTWFHGMPRDEMKYKPLDKCLPSDWRRRDDIRLLAVGNAKQAQEAKKSLEISQRKDRAARLEGK